jgi:hypothetical protein
MKLGKIPKRLNFYCRAETKIRFRWDDVEFEDPSAADVSAIPVFITDSENPNTQKTAISWASRAQWNWDPVTGKRVDLCQPYALVERDNLPVKSVRIIGLDVRGHGGRAYQALVDEKYLVDMREDVMLDTMLNIGMGVNATLPGEYIFAQIGGEMKLIRVGSKLHELMIETTEFGEKKPIAKLIPGRIYASKTKTVLYLGEVWHTQISQSYDHRSRQYTSTTVNPTRKLHLSIVVNHVSSDLKSALGDDKSYFTVHVEFAEKQSKAYREELAVIENFDIEVALAEVRRKIEVCYDDSGANRLDRYDLSYYSCMNISATTPGWIHPKIKEKLPA